MASKNPDEATSSNDSKDEYQQSPKRHRTTNIFNKTNSFAEIISEDFSCPICFNLIEEAHITKCGHTFCYGCIKKSLEVLGRCPKCNIITKADQLFPNFLLNDLISKHKERFLIQKSGNENQAEMPEVLREFIASESKNLTLPDVNVMLDVLNQRKQLLEAESCVAQNKLLDEFLKHLLKHKENEKVQLSKEIELIKKDIKTVENILKEMNQKCDLTNQEITKLEKINNDKEKTGHQILKKQQSDSAFILNKDKLISSSSQDSLTMIATRRRKMYAHFDDFVQCYFSCRSKDLFFGDQNDTLKSSSSSASKTDSSLDTFRKNLVKFSRYNRLRPLATLNYATDLFNNSTIVSSIEFDKDNEYFAIAGVTKRIKVFEYATAITDAVDIHYPIVEMISTSKISCISWNSYHKSILASSDYEGTVTVWDASTGQRTKTFQEHERRCWSVDFNNVDTRMIASGSDDARVKLWSLNEDRSVATLEVKANVCCVKFNPRSSYHLSFGSADHCVHYYDLRKMKEPYIVFKGHKKAVSYVKFLNSEELVSASTDSQLKMWKTSTPTCLRSFVGHINEKNFVGLATDGDYVACGSENNSLYVYYKGLSKQLFSFKFEPIRSLLDQEKKDDEQNEFVSAVCWRQNSNVLVAANSQGIIKILELV